MNDLEQNVIGRRTAGLLTELIESELSRLDDKAATVAVERLAEWMLGKRPADEPRRGNRKAPMNEAQSRMFERSKMPWGKYEGREVGIVAEEDFDYLRWAASEDEFRTDLRRYIDGGHGEPRHSG